MLLFCLTAGSASGHIRLQGLSSHLPKDWTATAYCIEHGRTLLSVGGSEKSASPATRAVLSALLALVLLGPDYRFQLRLVARGEWSSRVQVLRGDLILRGIHPSLMQGPEQWQAARKVQELGIRRITGKVIWESTGRSATGWSAGCGPVPLSQTPASKEAVFRRSLEIEEKLRLLGIDVSGASQAPSEVAWHRENRGENHGRDHQPTFELASFRSKPLALLIRQAPTMLESLFHCNPGIGVILRELAPSFTARDNRSLGIMSPEQSVALLATAVRRRDVGSELESALKPLSSRPPFRGLRGIFAVAGGSSELTGIAYLEGNHRLLFSLRVDDPTTEEELTQLARVILVFRGQAGLREEGRGRR